MRIFAGNFMMSFTVGFITVLRGTFVGGFITDLQSVLLQFCRQCYWWFYNSFVGSFVRSFMRSFAVGFITVLQAVLREVS